MICYAITPPFEVKRHRRGAGPTASRALSILAQAQQDTALLSTLAYLH